MNGVPASYCVGDCGGCRRGRHALQADKRALQGVRRSEQLVTIAAGSGTRTIGHG